MANQLNDWRYESLDMTRKRLRRPWGDYFLTILIINPINLRLVRIIAKAPVTPNHITLISFSLTLIAATFLSSVKYHIQAIGGGLLWLAFSFDCLDGDLARYKGLKSPLGALLDPVLDKLGWSAVIIGISLNAYFTCQEMIWLVLGLFLLLMSQFYYYITDAVLTPLRDQNEVSKNNHRKYEINNTVVRFGMAEPFIWGLSLLAFMGIVYIGIVVFLILFSIASIIQLFRLVKFARKLKHNQDEHFGIHVKSL